MNSSRRTVPRAFRVGLAAVVVYVLFAAVIGTLVGDVADGETAELALSHFIPLPIAIALGLMFVFRWSGWDARRVFRETPTTRLVPRRLWLVSIPVLMVALALSQVPLISWGDQVVGTVVVVVLATVLVGVGEELFLRGILLESLRARHGELVTLLGTSAVFGLAHVVGSVWAGVPPGAILFQVTFLTMNGSLLYWVRRVTGRLWAAMAVHALTDCLLYLSSGATSTSEALMQQNETDMSTMWPAAVLQTLLIVASLGGLVSVIREDRRTRSARHDDPAAAAPTEGRRS